MRTRRTYYKEYGLTNEQVLYTQKRCNENNMDEEEKQMLWDAAISTNQYIAKELYTSLSKNIGYRDTTELCGYIPYNYEDFYGYQRLCLVKFRNLLIFSGKY